MTKKQGIFIYEWKKSYKKIQILINTLTFWKKIYIPFFKFN